MPIIVRFFKKNSINMRFLLLSVCTILFSLQSNGQNSLTGISINHVPIVIADLKKARNLLSELGFKVKNGREHEGINNCFLKFQDGTYLEFVTPLDSKFSIGKYYTDFLKKRQGATALAVDIQKTVAAKHFLSKQNIRYTIDSNNIWQTINPQIKNAEIFFIEYADKNWKDSKENTTHNNGALQLNNTWYVTKNTKDDIKKYANLGFELESKSVHFGTSAYTLRLGRSKLILLETSPKIQSHFANKSLEGICGFTIKTSSIESIKKILKDRPQQNIIFDEKQALIYFTEYNFFMEFVE